MYEVVDNGCWYWRGAVNWAGYGIYDRTPAHRFIYMQLVKWIPKSLHPHHKCGHRHCVNPSHMEETTQKDHNRLKDHGRTVIDANIAAKIREEYRKGKKKKTISEELGVAYHNVRWVLDNKSWIN